METKCCSQCGRSLLRPIDEFGDLRDPVCISCFLNPGPSPKDKKDLAIEEKEEELEELDRQINGIEGEIEDLNSDLWDLQTERLKVLKAIKELKEPKVKKKADKVLSPLGMLI